MSGQPGRRLGNTLRGRSRRPIVIEIHDVLRREPGSDTLFSARLFLAIYVLVVLAGTIVLMTPWVTTSGNATPVQDALFTAVSATSVTGLVTLDTRDHWNLAGQITILVMIQAGGLGFMVGASLVLRMIGRGEGRRLRDAIMIRDNIPTLSLSEAVSLSRRIVKFTVVVEFIGAVILAGYFAREMPVGSAVWHGLFHSISAFCNAGFDLQGGFQSMVPYRESPLINLVFIVLITLGSVSFIVLADVENKRRWRMLHVNSKIILVSSLVLTIIGFVTFLSAEWGRSMAGTADWTKPMQALFQSVSGRTAGFSTVDFAETHHFTLFIYMALMFIGGASGSTSGGVKLATVAVVLVAVLSTLRGREEPALYGRRLPTALVYRAMAIIVIYFGWHFLVTFAVAVTETYFGDGPAFVRLLFESMSAVATNGLGNRVTPDLSTPGKLVISVAMFVGRVGPLLAAYALQRKRSRQPYRYPETLVHIG